MHRIDNSSAVTTMPTRKPPGTAGFFSFGDQTVGQLATIVEADILNAIMMEISNVVTGAGLTLNKTDDTQLRQAITAMLGALSAATVVKFAATSGAYTPSAHLKLAVVELWGGGGGGGSAPGFPAYAVTAATGGASGAYCYRVYTPTEIGASGTIVVGGGGAGGAAGVFNGADGGQTSFSPAGTGAGITANGGGGGQYGLSAGDIRRGSFLAASPSAANGHLNLPGHPGSWPLLFGGSAIYEAIGGSGGHAPVFATGGGQEAQEDANGNPANHYGGGGGGAAALTVSRAGGNGFQGLVRITEYCWG
jgi:hypothetical protein